MFKPPRDLELYWYQRLEEQGFHDIEDFTRSDRPLKSWESWILPSKPYERRRAYDEEYQSTVDTFLHREDFDEICTIIIEDSGKGTKGGRPSVVTSIDIRAIWEFHCQGLTERQIAENLKRSKTCIHKLIESLRAWMKLA